MDESWGNGRNPGMEASDRCGVRGFGDNAWHTGVPTYSLFIFKEYYFQS